MNESNSPNAGLNAGSGDVANNDARDDAPDDAPDVSSDAASPAPDDGSPRVGAPEITLCPYCGHANTQSEKCSSCGGLFEPLSLKATQIAMGPWFIRDKKNPFRPGCSFETLRRMADSGKLKPTTVLRGPTTRQFWSVARNVPGVAHRLGYCHNCNAHVDPNAAACPACQAAFGTPAERNELGLQYPTQVKARSAQKRLDAQIAAELNRQTAQSGTGATGNSTRAASATTTEPDMMVSAPDESLSEVMPGMGTSLAEGRVADMIKNDDVGDSGLLADVLGVAPDFSLEAGGPSVVTPVGASGAVPVPAVPNAVASSQSAIPVAPARVTPQPKGGLSPTAIIMITLNIVLLGVAVVVGWLLLKGD